MFKNDMLAFPLPETVPLRKLRRNWRQQALRNQEAGITPSGSRQELTR